MLVQAAEVADVGGGDLAVGLGCLGRGSVLRVWRVWLSGGLLGGLGGHCVADWRREAFAKRVARNVMSATRMALVGEQCDST